MQSTQSLFILPSSSSFGNLATNDSVAAAAAVNKTNKTNQPSAILDTANASNVIQSLIILSPQLTANSKSSSSSAHKNNNNNNNNNINNNVKTNYSSAPIELIPLSLKEFSNFTLKPCDENSSNKIFLNSLSNNQNGNQSSCKSNTRNNLAKVRKERPIKPNIKPNQTTTTTTTSNYYLTNTYAFADLPASLKNKSSELLATTLRETETKAPSAIKRARKRKITTTTTTAEAADTVVAAPKKSRRQRRNFNRDSSLVKKKPAAASKKTTRSKLADEELGTNSTNLDTQAYSKSTPDINNNNKNNNNQTSYSKSLFGELLLYGLRVNLLFIYSVCGMILQRCVIGQITF